MKKRNIRFMIEHQYITHWYQPIMDLDKNDIIGYEALMRCIAPYQYTPQEVLTNAKIQGYYSALDRQLLVKAQSIIKDIVACPVFLNIFPSTILSPGFLKWWDHEGDIADEIVLEISESEEIDDWDEFKAVVKELQHRGIKIALDDMGSSYSFLKHWIELNPNYIKLDRYYAQDLAGNIKKQKVVGNFIDLFRGTTHLILEGLETDTDLQAAKALGIIFAQGYYFGRPMPWDTMMDKKELQNLNKCAPKVTKKSSYGTWKDTIGSI